ncbi:MAG: hypothetical protein ISR76_07630 [Planctomycetes bacterium]|nr:hypothetical protein [Planctomycetota bacterium]MBL7008854.1 hypothetical protein [Planctomycetota bacterium]
MLLSPSTLLSVCLAAASPLHLPHDDVQDVACGFGPGGQIEIVVAANAFSKVIRSTDLGLSWIPVAGDGLEFRDSNVVEYWPRASAPRYWIGTDQGVWSYSPATGAVVERSVGLAPGDGFITDIAAPRTGNGPAALCTRLGNVYLWDEAGEAWSLCLSSGHADDLGRVAIAPAFDPFAAPGPDRCLFAGLAGQLHRSIDGGQSWSLVAPFDQPAAAAPGDWWIPAIALAEDFASSGQVVLGRGREDPLSPTGSAGELWSSADFGASFSLRHLPGSALRRLEAAPPDALGARHFFATVQAFPERGQPGLAPGVLRSQDGGLSWTDQGSEQDFFLTDEHNLGLEAGLERRIGLAVSPDYASDGLVLLARGSGLYRSRSGGQSWRAVAVRPPANVRELDLAIDAAGHLIAFGATNGGGMLRADLSVPDARVLDQSPVHFARGIAASRNYAVDGSVALAGEGGVALWFDPALPPANPFGRTGFLFAKGPQNCRFIAGHPRLDLSAPPTLGSGTLYWSYLSPLMVLYSDDGGLSLGKIDTLAGGGPAPYMRRLAIAPSYDPAAPGGAADVYTISQRHLFRLGGGEWQHVDTLPTNLYALAVDPGFERPANPRLFVGELYRPAVHLILDHPAGVVRVELPSTGLDGQVRSLAVPPDFDLRPVLYAAVWGAGVRKIDLGAAQPAWEPVGTAFPALWTDVVGLSPGFAVDRTVVVGTHEGLYYCVDQPGEVWTAAPAPHTLDDTDSVLTSFDPAAPGNPDPARPWPWAKMDRWIASKDFGVPVVGSELSYTSSDGAAFEWEGHASRCELRSFRGPAMGRVVLSAYDHRSGALIASVTEDLHDAGGRQDWRVVLDLPSRQAVWLRAEAALDPGEFLAVDGFTIHP